MSDSLVDAFFTQITQKPHTTALTFLAADGAEEPVTRERLHQDALRTASALKARGIEAGDLVLLTFPPSYELVGAFWGVLYRGAMPAILPSFDPRVGAAEYARRVAATAVASAARAVMTTPELAETLREALAGASVVIASDDIASSGVDRRAVTPGSATDIAYIQFSGGTTGLPKGVMLSHQAVLSSLSSVAEATEFTADSVSVGWLPLYHDMGLITQVLLPLMTGASSVLIPPAQWIRRPSLLLRAIHTYAGTMTWMPNFAFNHCVRHIEDDAIAGCSLRSWRLLGNGAEPVQWESMERFARRFAPFGFDSRALRAGYGMAENVVGVSTTPPGSQLAGEWISVVEAQEANRALPVGPEATAAQHIVNCGRPLRGTEVAIVGEDGRALPERQIGEVVVRGASLFSGYYRQPELTAGAMRDGWYHTGDLAYLANGELYVYGRKEEMIIMGGHNVRPQEIERIAQAVLGEQSGLAAAFGVRDEDLGTELPAVGCELRSPLSAGESRDLARKIRQRVLQELDVVLANVQLVERGWILTSSNGKVARAANRRKYQDVFQLV
ncbi:MAG TPA: AMP-binding protein [Ardenticatenaceae bacterium]|nr:AMP-binding protein [Ardenticatenaceae bacterium]